VFGTAFQTGYLLDNNFNWFLANIRLVGLEFTYQPLPQAAYAADMPAGKALVDLEAGSSGIIVDRCWIHGYPPPFRVYNILQWHGTNLGIVDSYINDMHLPRTYNRGLGVH
jgi:hypothetical protein